MRTPLVSIILPTYNGAKWLGEALESVLAQSYTNWELLVLDDGSNDNTAEIVALFTQNEARVRYIENETNLGIQKTLNKGLKESRGEYIARIDDDDMWIDKDKLKNQVEFLEANRDYVLVGTGAVIIDDNNKELGRFRIPETDADIRNKILSKNCFLHSSVLFRKDAVMKCKGYSELEDTKHIEDYDLWLKMGTIGKIYNLNIYAVSLKQGWDTISSKNRITQAVKIISHINKFKNSYPNFLKGKVVGVLRLIFFFIQKSFPLNNKLLYKIKSSYKNF